MSIAYVVKGILHVILDSRNGHRSEYSSVNRFVYILPYDKDVNEKDENLKKICNFFNKLSLIFLSLFIIIFFLKNYVFKSD